MQIVGYETKTEADGDPAALLFADDGAINQEPLTPGRELAYRLETRHCAGATDGDVHVACDDPSAPYCDAHTSTWVCARCTGVCLKDEMDCYEEHAVYLAAFAPDIFKVGVTREWRLEERLVEQGADRAAHLYTVSNGRIAREVEADIATDLVDRVRVPSKIDGIHQSVDESAWNALLDTFDVIDTRSFDDEFTLAERPVTETIAAGTILGTKGRVLVLENAGSTYAVDMRDLVGHETGSGRPDRELQASLGAFG